MYTSPPDRPESAEPLYLRYRRENFLNGQFAPEAIRSQLKQSVNRGGFSEPEDVLFSETGQYNGLGVVEFRVADIPGRLEQLNGPPYVFFVRHEPQDENYAHSEIWSDHDPQTGGFRSPSRTISLEFRVRLCRSIRQDRVRIPATR